MTPPAIQWDWLFLGIGWALGACGVGLGAWALFWDRARGRRRCPKCWYDMAGVPGLRCPECGREARYERRLAKTRRRTRWAVVGLLLLGAGAITGAWPGVSSRGWPSLVPSSILVFLATPDPHVAPQIVAGGILPPGVILPGPTGVTPTRPTPPRALPLGAFPPPPRGPAPSMSIAERLRREAWDRFYDGRLYTWQAEVLFRRCLRRLGIAELVAIDAPPRWPEGEPLPVKVRLPSTSNILITPLRARASLDPARPVIRTGPEWAWSVPFRLHGANAGTPNRVRFDLLARNRVVFGTVLGLNTVVVRGREALMERIDDPAVGRALQQAFEAALVRLDDGRVGLSLSARAGDPALAGEPFRVIARVEIVVDGRVVGRGARWANLGWANERFGHTLPVDWGPDAPEVLAAGGGTWG